jgi:beta-glucanase (GH16 family)
MLQSWNKVCFTGGYIEVAVTLPGNGSHGFWPAVWTLGNLGRVKARTRFGPSLMGRTGRAGYPSSTDGIWVRDTATKHAVEVA